MSTILKTPTHSPKFTSVTTDEPKGMSEQFLQAITAKLKTDSNISYIELEIQIQNKDGETFYTVKWRKLAPLVAQTKNVGINIPENSQYVVRSANFAVVPTTGLVRLAFVGVKNNE